KIISVAASAGIGVGAGGAGLAIGASVARNFIGYDLDGHKTALGVLAYATDTSVHTTGAYSLTATANSSIDALVLAVSAAVAGGFTTTGGGDVSLWSKENAVIDATSTAVALSAAGALGASVALSGAGAVATNVILGKDYAYVSGGKVTSAGGVSITSEDKSQI